MARRVAFRYLPGKSVLHRWDSRCKLVGLGAITYGMLRGGGSSLVFFSLILLGCLGIARLPWRSLLLDLRGWSLLLGLIFITQSVDSSGEGARWVTWLPMTKSSLEVAGLAVWRLGLILVYSALFSLVTRSREMQSALLWFLRPFPFLPARRIALMMGLVVRFLPLTLDALEEVRLANRARLGDRVRNPLKRIRHLVIPVLRQALKRADEMAIALEARGYREDLEITFPPIPSTHLAGLLAVMTLMGVVPAFESLSGFLFR